MIKSALAVAFLLVLAFPVRIYDPWWIFLSYSILDAVLLIGGAGVVIRILARGGVGVGNIRIFIVLLMPILVSVISITWTMDSVVTLKSIVSYGPSLVAFLMVIALFDKWTLTSLRVSLVVFSAFLIGTALITYAEWSPISPETTLLYRVDDDDVSYAPYYARFSHPYIGISNSFATVLAMLLPLLSTYTNKSVQSWWSAFPQVALLAAVIATMSRGVIAAVFLVFAAVCIWSAFVRYRVSARSAAIAAMGVSVSAVFLLISPSSIQFVNDRFSSSNVNARFEALIAAFRVISEYPVLGVGAGVPLNHVSDVALAAVHNAYIQNVLWFGPLFGGGLSLMMLLLPLLVYGIPVKSVMAGRARFSLVISVSILMLINMSQASWEGPVLRVLIYAIIAFGILMIRAADREFECPHNASR